MDAQLQLDSAIETRLDQTYGKLPLSFEVNQGQTDDRVKFLSRGSGHALFLTPGQVVLALTTTGGGGNRGTLRNGDTAKWGRRDAETGRNATTRGHRVAASDTVLRMELLGANPSPELVGLDELPGKVNHFIGDDPEKWRTDIATYAKVKYEDVYSGVDLVYYGKQQQLEYDFIVAPGADPDTIRLGFEGADRLEVDTKGNLILHISTGMTVETPRWGVSTIQTSEIRMHRPLIYQEVDGARREIAGGYVLHQIPDQEYRESQSDHSSTQPATGTPHFVVGFELASYDTTKPLIIDPVLAYSTYLGGSGDDRFPIMAVDPTGNIYLAGQTTSTNFPTANPVQPNHGGGPFPDLFVTKLNATGTALLYSTYIGGSGGETSPSIAVDRAGSAYVIGRTASLNLPTVNPLQPTHGGGMFDAFVVKLNATGSALVYSTYLGGSGVETSWDIKVDASGNAYAGGSTASTNFPTVNAVQPTYGGGLADAFVAKLNAAGTALVYSTYLGGSGNEPNTPNLAVDDAGNAYVHGQTSSLNFPTVNPVQPTYGGGPLDVFVAKLNATGTSLLYSTYLGGIGSDMARTIVADAVGNAFITGFTGSRNFPVQNPLQPTHGGGPFDAFIAKLNAAGTALVYSTYLGGDDRDAGTGIALDVSGNAYVVGFTTSANFPTVNPLQEKYGGPPGGGEIGGDGFVAKLNGDGSALIYSTYLGGSGEEEATYLGLDAAGNAYVTGQTDSIDFQTVNPLQPTYGGGRFDAFVAKISEILASGTFHFAQVGGGGGLSTGIFLTNPSTTKSASGTVSFFGSDGRPLEGIVTNAVIPFVIQPSGTAATSTSSQGIVRSGYARVSSSDPVFANATYSLAGLPSLSVGPSLPPAYVFSAAVSRDSLRGIEVGASAVNVTDQRVTAVFSLADTRGRAIRSLRAARILEPGEQASETLRALFPTIPPSFEGSLRIAALSPLPTQSLSVTVIRFGPGLFNAVPLIPLARSSPLEEESME